MSLPSPLFIKQLPPTVDVWSWILHENWGGDNLHYAICTNRVIFFALRVSYWFALWFSSYNFCTKLCHVICTFNLCSYNLHYCKNLLKIALNLIHAFCTYVFLVWNLHYRHDQDFQFQFALHFVKHISLTLCIFIHLKCTTCFLVCCPTTLGL